MFEHLGTGQCGWSGGARQGAVVAVASQVRASPAPIVMMPDFLSE